MQTGAWSMIAAASAVGLLAGGSAAAAAPFDGSAPMLCAFTELSSCAPGRDCRQETPDSLNVPRFVRVDVKGKTLGGTRPDGQARTTPIEFEAHEAGRTFLGGVDGPLSWHIDVDEASGDMLIAATGMRGDGPFTVGGFGACTVP